MYHLLHYKNISKHGKSTCNTRASAGCRGPTDGPMTGLARAQLRGRTALSYITSAQSSNQLE